MTTNTAPRPLSAHAHCSHPVTKQARAKCRKERGAAYANAQAARATKRVVETCCCGGKHRAGFTMNTEGVWVCADCDRPTKGYAANVLFASAA